MPCYSAPMEPTKEEIALSMILAFLEELETGVLPSYYKNGYSDKVYSKSTKKLLDLTTRELCSKLKALPEEEIKNKSLELQIWWRDHKVWDGKREKLFKTTYINFEDLYDQLKLNITKKDTTYLYKDLIKQLADLIKAKIPSENFMKILVHYIKQTEESHNAKQLKE